MKSSALLCLSLFCVLVVRGNAETTTPLTKAIRLENYADAKKQTKKSLVNLKDAGGYHPLSYAVFTGNDGLVEHLLKAGANPNQVEENKKTPLYVAANLGRPDLVELLHRYGATYPDADEESPIRIAMQCGSIETLALLLKLYPEKDVNDGWPWPKVVWESERGNKDLNTPLYARSALIHAIVAGMPKMVFFLLSQGVDLNATDSNGRTALHLAAWSPLFDERLVSELLKKGLSPVARSHHHHFGPSTALDFAAMSGSLEKVRAMCGRLKLDQNRKAIRRSALIASAYGNDRVMEFLFAFLGERQPSARSLMIGSDENESEEQDHVFEEDEFSQLDLPNLSVQESGKRLKEGSIALISSNGLEDISILLEARLSELAGVTVVERNGLNPLVSEKLLGAISQGVSKDARKQFLSIDAQQLLFLNLITLPSGKYLEVTLVSSITGLIQARNVVLLDGDPDEEWIGKYLGGIIEQVSIGRSVKGGATAVSLTPLVANSVGGRSLSLVKTANIVLPTAVSRSPGKVLLERSQLAHLEIESTIGNRNDYWEAGWIVEGGLEIENEQEIMVSLAAKSVAGLDSVHVEVDGKVDDVSSVVFQAWQQLDEKMGGAAHKPLSKSIPGSGEASELIQQARWFLEAEYPKDAARLAEAAYVLGNRSGLVLRTITEAGLETLPERTKRFCGHVRSLPASLPLDTRLRTIYEIDHYFELCQSARLYLATSAGPLDLKIPSQKSYNKAVTDSLHELFFYRLMVDDSLHTDQDRQRVADLDGEIQTLISDLLKRIRGSEYEIATINLLLGFQPRYLSRYGKKEVKAMEERVLELASNRPKSQRGGMPGMYSLVNTLVRIAEPLGGHELPQVSSDGMVGLLEKLFKEGRLVGADHEELLQGLLVYQDSRSKKLALMNQLKSRDALSNSYSSIDHRLRDALETYLAVEVKGGVSSVDVIEGGFQNLVLKPEGEFFRTAEYRRRIYSYQLLSLFAKSPAKEVEFILKVASGLFLSQGESASKKDAKDYLFIREFLSSHGKLTAGVERELKSIYGSGETPGLGRGSLDAEFRMELPGYSKRSAASQHLRAHQVALDGDHLWIPTTFFTPGTKGVNKVPWYSDALHVVNLVDGGVRSVHFPEARDGGNVRLGQRVTRGNDPAFVRRVFIGPNYAYFLSDWEPTRLYVVEKKSLSFVEVKLPMPYVIAACADVRDDSFYLSLTDTLNPDFNRNKKHARTTVLQVLGDGTTEVIQSSHRKPSKSPMDRPGVVIDAIRRNDDRLLMISNKEMSYMKPEAFEFVQYQVKMKRWSKVQNGKAASRSLGNHMNEYVSDFYSLRRIKIQEQEKYLTDAFIGQSPFQKLVVAKDLNSALRFQEDWLGDKSKFSLYQLLEVTAEVPVGVSQLSRDLIPSELYGESLSPAIEILKAGEYGVIPICVWKDQVVIALVRSEVVMPGLWTLPLSGVKEAVK